MQIIKIFILFIFTLSCNDKVTIKNIYINKTQKVKIQKQWESEYTISYLWSKPQGPENHQAEWIVNDDILLFTPYKTGLYSIAVSIENSMGDVLGEEFFQYNVINKKNKSVNLNNNKTPKIKEPPQVKEKYIDSDNDYSIQISSWSKLNDAENDMQKLINLGFNAYIDKKIVARQIFYRVRIGKNLSYNGILEIKKELEKKKIHNFWIDKK